MTRFSYKAKSTPEKTIDGTIDADTLENAVRKIIQLGYSPIDVYPAEKHPALRPPDQRQWGLRRSTRISLADRALLIRQLYDLIDAGIPLLRALQLTFEQIKKPGLKEIVVAIINSV